MSGIIPRCIIYRDTAQYKSALTFYRLIMAETCFSWQEYWELRVTRTSSTKWLHIVVPHAASYTNRIHTACDFIWVAFTDSESLASLCLFLSLFSSHSIIKTEGRAMEVVTHFVNDTVEFYKWGLTIAGKLFFFFLNQTRAVCHFRCMVIVCCYHCHKSYQVNLVGNDKILVLGEIGECTEKKR